MATIDIKIATLELKMIDNIIEKAQLCQVEQNNLLKALTRSLLRLVRTSTCLPRAGYRIDKTDPHLINEGDIGHFYTIDNEDFDNYLFGFFSQPHRELMTTFNDRSLMIRAAALEVTSCLAKLDPTQPVPRFLFYGRRGAGITCQQAQVAHWCARHGWLLVHSHSFDNILRYTPDPTKSTVRPGRFDTPTASVAWLKYFSEINRQWLAQHQPKITAQVVWNLNESNEAGTPWETIIQYGIARPKYATDCIGVLLREVRNQAVSSVGSPSGGLRALVCIDGVNSLWSSGSMLRDSDSKPILAKDLSLFHFFRKLTGTDWCNAVLVGSVSSKASWVDQRESCLPRYLLGAEGWAALDPFVPIFVDHMSGTEARRFIEYLLDMGWITNTAAKDELGRVELMNLSDRNPKELVKLTAEW